MASRKQSGWPYDHYSSQQRSLSPTPYAFSSSGGRSPRPSSAPLDQHQPGHIPSLPPMSNSTNRGSRLSEPPVDRSANSSVSPPCTSEMPPSTQQLQQPLHSHQLSTNRNMHDTNNSSLYYRSCERQSLPASPTDNHIISAIESFRPKSFAPAPSAYPSQSRQQSSQFRMDYQYSQQIYAQTSFRSQQHSQQQPRTRDHTADFNGQYPPQRIGSNTALNQYHQREMQHRSADYQNQHASNSRQQQSSLNEEVVQRDNHEPMHDMMEQTYNTNQESVRNVRDQRYSTSHEPVRDMRHQTYNTNHEPVRDMAKQTYNTTHKPGRDIREQIHSINQEPVDDIRERRYSTNHESVHDMREQRYISNNSPQHHIQHQHPVQIQQQENNHLPEKNDFHHAQQNCQKVTQPLKKKGRKKKTPGQESESVKKTVKKKPQTDEGKKGKINKPRAKRKRKLSPKVESKENKHHDNLMVPVLPLIDQTQTDLFQRPNSAPVSMKNPNTLVSYQQNDVTTNTITSYLHIINRLIIIWSKLENIFTTFSERSGRDENDTNLLIRIIPILFQMGLPKPIDEHSNLDEIVSKKDLLVKIKLYRGSLAKVSTLPQIISDESRVVEEICLSAMHNLEHLIKQYQNIDAGNVLINLRSELEEIGTEVENLNEENKILGVKMKDINDYNKTKISQNKMKINQNITETTPIVRNPIETNYYSNNHISMTLPGNMLASSPLKRSTAKGPSSHDFLGHENLLLTRRDMPILTSNESYVQFQNQHNIINSNKLSLGIDTNTEHSYDRDLSNVSQTSRIKKSLKKQESSAKPSVKRKKKSPKSSCESKESLNGIDLENLSTKTKNIRKTGKKSIKKLASKLNGKSKKFNGKNIHSKGLKIAQPLSVTGNIESDGLLSSNKSSLIGEEIQEVQKPKISKCKIFVEDHMPDRVTNPLLQMPLYPPSSKGMHGSPSIETIPNGAEIWNLTQIYFPTPNTYPINYLARVLGFNVTQSAPKNKICNFDIKSLQINNVKDDPYFQIPKLGKFAENVNNQKNEEWLNKNKEKHHRSCDNAINDNDEEKLDFIDPVWRAIKKCHRGLNDDRFTLANGLSQINILSKQCIEFAIEHGVISKDDRFRFANLEDSELLFRLDEENQQFISEFDFSMALKCPSQFFIIAESSTCGPLGFIHYKFCWYKLEDNKTSSDDKSCNIYSIGSAARNLRKESVSELVLCIEGIHMKGKHNGKKEISGKDECKNCDRKTNCEDGSKLGNIDLEVDNISNKPTDLSLGMIENDKSESLKVESEHLVAPNTEETPFRKSDGIKPLSFIEANNVGQESKKLERSVTTSTLIVDERNPQDTQHDNLVLVLTALALEHARNCDIWYGLHGVKCHFVQFFSQFFRMTRLSKSTGSDDTISVQMACDLKKCNFRYAILHFKEFKTLNKPCDSVKSSEKIRMLVHIPNIRKNKFNDLVARNTINSNGCNNSNANIGNNSQVTEKNHFNRCLRNSNSILISVQLQKPNDDRVLSKPVSSTSSDLRNVSEGHSDLKMTDTDMDKLAWKVLKVFHHSSGSTNRSTSLSSNLDSSHSFSILSELKKKQNELSQLEAGLNPGLQNLLLKSYEERMNYESSVSRKKRKYIEEAKNGYNAVIERRKEADLAWQIQLEQDMDAVCDICNDGEVTVENQILFCEACNVAVHQKCYGISKVPSGDYFCHACRYFKRDLQISRANRFSGERSKSAPSPLPICCELCPRKQGAFLQCQKKSLNKKKTGIQSKWVHVVCAKWQGLQFVDDTKETVEDVTELRRQFRLNEFKCCLCKGMRGAFNICSEEGCNKAMHVTCARSSGICTIIHGENHEGLLDSGTAWTLKCPEHSKIEPDDVPDGSLTIDQLETAAQDFPPEPIPEPLPKPFPKQNSKERKKYFEKPENEFDFIREVSIRMEGRRCEVCAANPIYEDKILVCSSCKLTVHPGCYVGNWNTENGTCESCTYKELSIDTIPPHCHMCNQSGGVLVKSFAVPINRKRWSNNPKGFKNSLFGKQIWCHAICGMWHSKTHVEERGIDCSSIVMSNGIGHIESNVACNLCGRKDKIKVACSNKECKIPGVKKNTSFRFHVTCARQAGLDVSDSDDPNSEIIFKLHCFHHVRPEFVLRAKLEDMIEVERRRAGNDLSNTRGPMSLETASLIFNWGIHVMQCLGWAWRWVDWWVAKGDNWEPLIEDGQDESKMTKEELRIVDSTPESRRYDARNCRLAAFGAALRNRDFDEGGDDHHVLGNALRAIFNTRSLVGPLNKLEIDFFVEWLARVYRSNDPRLGFGEYKTPVTDDEKDLNVYYSNGRPKFELGGRPLPGKAIKKKQIFEICETDYDDFDTIVAESSTTSPSPSSGVLSKRKPKKSKR